MRLIPLRFLVILIVLGLSACQSDKSESDTLVRTRPPALTRELRKVMGSAVNFNIDTFRGIRCATYEQQFGDATPFLIEDPVQLQAIAHRLAVRQPDTIGLEPDVRAKAVLFYNDQTQDTLCIGRFISLYRGQCLRADTALYQLLGVGLEE